ncbi:hypothetical protein BN1058_00486 [Paraliobacillus sp. PM-2]|uniref:hypothetical protein n=1 Tax=Paraliobacillus sp. PM-2 TaxID=1462524 RepID=UPI00061C0321|nr:hypothetical protein [Paraliobacillus sp. PM-2]CQR46233.1 hypothetical protein BN1058_00486 [Paraliobacillus sp. PM-2]
MQYFTHFKVAASSLVLFLVFFIPNSGLIGIPVITSVFFIIYGLLMSNKKVEKKLQITPIYILILPLIYSLLIILFSQSGDLYYFILFTKLIIISLGLYYIIILFNLNIYEGLKSILMVLLVNVLITYVQYFDLFSLGDFALNLNSTFLLHAYKPYRAMGLMAGYDANGIIIAMTFVLSIVLIKISNSQTANLLYSASAIFCGFAIFFTSRTGLVTLLLFFLIYSFLSSKNLFRYLTNIIIYTLIIIVMLLAGSKIIKSEYPTLYEQSYNFMFEAFINYSETGELYTSSFDNTLENHYEITNNLIKLIFGTSYSNASKIGGYSDVGYVQIINGLGIIGLIIVIFIYIYWFIKLINMSIFFKKQLNIKINIIYYLYTFILVMFITNIKGPYFFANTIFFLFLFLFNLVYIKFKNSRNILIN